MKSILFVGFVFRIGEAKNPGPHDQGVTIGCLNPTGVLHKACTFSSLPTKGKAIWGVSETHLSRQGIQKFHQELGFRKSRYKFFPGAPAPLRSQSATSLGGKQVGTGFLSDVPGRPLQPSWPREAWDESRFNMHAFFVQGHWIYAACFYGYAYRAESTEVRQITDSLLEHITKRIVMSLRGKRVIVGDFNQTDGNLNQTEIWKTMGWKEIQVLSQERTGRPISNTCKNRTTKDFIWISPELQPYFEEVETKELYVDHTVLCAHFKPFGKPSKIPVWRKPSDIDWNNYETSIPSKDFTIADKVGDEAMIAIAEEFESRVDSCLAQDKGGLHNKQKGRSKTKEVKWMQEHGSPITPSRHGEKIPEFHGHSLQHKQWFQQVRRLQSIVRLANKPEPRCLNQRIHMHRERRSILQSSGFPRGFPVWWKNMHFKVVGAPLSLPRDVPEPSILIAVAVSFDAAFQHLEAILVKQLTTKAQQSRIADPNKVFADVRKPRVAPISILDDSVRVAAELTNREQGLVTLQKETKIDLDKPVFLEGGQTIKITRVDQNKLTIDNPEDIPDVFVIRQDSFEADLQNLFSKVWR